MKFAAVAIVAFAAPTTFAFAPAPFGVRPATLLQAEIRGPRDSAFIKLVSGSDKRRKGGRD